MRLRGKFLALLLPVGFSAAGLILFLIHVSVHSVIIKGMEKSASILAKSAAQDTAAGLQAKSEAALLPLLQSLQKRGGALYAAALDARGVVVADTSIAEKGKSEPGTAAAFASPSDPPVVRSFSLRGEPVMEISVPVWSAPASPPQDVFLLSGESRGGPATLLGVLKVGMPLESALETERRISRSAFLIVVSIGGVALGLVLWLVRGILKPVSALMTGIAEMGRGNNDVKVPILSRDELGDLARRFNEMSEELARTTVSKEYVEGILDNMADFLVVADERGRIERINRAALEALSYSAQEAIGAPLSTIFQGEDGSVMNAGEIRDKEVSLRTKSGREIPAIFSSSVLKDRSGAFRGHVGVAKDMTERKRFEAELLAAKIAAESASRELEAFSYSVAHDLRAPVRAIDGFSQALLESHADKLDAEGKDFLSRVRGGSKRMGQLIDDLLNLSRVTRSVMRRERFDISRMAQEICDQLRNTQPQRSVEFVIAQGLSADGDPNLLRAALENLLGNAWKYTKKHPRARIEFGETSVDGKKAYFVRDDGAGFDMAFAKKLFKPFSRLHSMTEFEGTGIGLATVQRIMARHGGEIWGEGQVERGSVFYFTLSGGKT